MQAAVAEDHAPAPYSSVQSTPHRDHAIDLCVEPGRQTCVKTLTAGEFMIVGPQHGDLVLAQQQILGTSLSGNHFAGTETLRAHSASDARSLPPPSNLIIELQHFVI